MRLLNIHGVDDVRLDEYQRPEAGPNDVVIKMKSCGICGSDLSAISRMVVYRRRGRNHRARP
jgi:(R,R)-butanediol dehydrogenase/meso-butanediol dehydrogenase/diacetyl reductase